MNRFFYLLTFHGIVLFGNTVSCVVAAEPPVVAFDVNMVVSCREMTPPSALSKNKVIEAVFKISSSVEVGTESDISDLVFTISDDKTTKTLGVLEFLPKSEVYTDIVDPIVVIEMSETDVTGQLSATYRTLSPNGLGTLDTSVKGHSSSTSSVQYKKLAPKELLVASGTKDRRHAVFFKLKPSTQMTLEGERTFSVIYSVPQDWKADWIYVNCKAIGFNRGVILDSQVESGLAGYAVGLHLDGDENARSAAMTLAKRQQELLDELAKTKNAKSWLNIAWEWLWFLSKLSPVQGAAATNAQLHGLLMTKAATEIEEGLPPSVVVRLEALNAAKAQLEKLSGGQSIQKPD